MAAGRMQRWALFLSGFDYSIRYIKGSDNVKADALSRLPMKTVEINEGDEVDYFNFLETVNVIDSIRLRAETRKDTELSKVFNFIRYGFPHTKDSDLLPYCRRKDELTVEKGVIMWGYRAVIPAKLRQQLLAELHSTHEGISKMKANARAYFWWPALDSDIEKCVSSCRGCMHSRSEPNKSVLTPNLKTYTAFERVHADFLGPIKNKIILVIIDMHSKWPQAYIMNSTDAGTTIEKFRDYFSIFGLPSVCVTDNGPQFTSNEFSKFLSMNGVKHVTSPPYHPSSNGFAENFVKSIKNGICKSLKDDSNRGVSLETILNRFLFHYRNSVHTSTGVTPSSLVFRNKPKNRLDRLLEVKSSSDNKVKDYKGNRQVNFKIEERVWCRDYRNPNKKGWVEAKIEEIINERVYLCRVLGEELIWKRHVDQILKMKGDKVENMSKTVETGERVQFQTVDNEIGTKLNNSNIRNPENIKNDSLVKVQPNNECKEQNLTSESELVVNTENNFSNNSSGEDNFCSKNTVSDWNSNSRPKRVIKPPVRLNL
uniref:RNA-directed DNA polymerase n=2 Tax=Photinus pyralis TaxID=7054 RepID=A0A1Y1K1P5_PHOPY